MKPGASKKPQYWFPVPRPFYKKNPPKYRKNRLKVSRDGKQSDNFTISIQDKRAGKNLNVCSILP